MIPLKFTGNISMEEIFTNHKTDIYDKVVEAIVKAHGDSTVDKVEVMTLTINDLEYTIDLSKDNFISSLESAIAVYETTEEYEKCQLCINLIKKINYLS